MTMLVLKKKTSHIFWGENCYLEMITWVVIPHPCVLGTIWHSMSVRGQWLRISVHSGVSQEIFDSQAI